LLFLTIIKKTITIIKAIIDVRILYKSDWSKDKRPNAIPSFQIKLIFKNFDENNSLV
jgi:hypothetical protein